MSVSGIGVESGYVSDQGVRSWSAPSAVELTYTQTLDTQGSMGPAQIATPARTTTPFGLDSFSGGTIANTIRMARIQPTGPYAGYVTHTARVSDPTTAGWDYQSFGLWQGWDPAEPNRSFNLAGSVGWATPAAAIPTAGSARFEGQLLGLVVFPGANTVIHETFADITLTASFADRRVDFATTTDLTGPAVGFLKVTPYRLSGSLTYLPGQNRLSGGVTMTNSSLTGTVTAQFYGPAAEEIGGVMALTGPPGVAGSLVPERLTAAFGAKRR